ncbi:metal-dependent hydrolase [Halalkalibacter kiskunsagensis]|uniref:Metal-dependent hydrolase n=1 Tax=Halalkalibacter kiskunsagensis TaxID=1548599 RepID=A0ABV6KGW5_9BACI
MKGPTHIVGGLAAATFTANILSVPNQEPMIFYGAALFGAIIPDICHPRSMIGRTVPLLSNLLSKMFGHRSITHSLLFIFLIYFGLEQFEFRGSYDLQLGIVVGVISHILLDLLTPQGTKLFYPIKSNIRIPFYVKTGSIIGETSVMAILIVMTIYLLVV